MSLSLTDLEIIEAFRSRNRSGYETLVREIRDACEELKDSIENGNIYRVYSRGSKQDGDELKTAIKILEKIEPPITDSSITNVYDIIGLTVVIYYFDKSSHIFDEIERKLSAKSIRRAWGPTTYNDGYFATHAVFRSTHIRHSNLRCEIQIKTVLHDAWSAKMHDLTYKPAGAMDARLGGLMGSVASQIQGIEEQSITIRKIITGRHRLENRAFQAYCDAVFLIVFKLGKDAEPAPAETEGGAPNTASQLELLNPSLSTILKRITNLRCAAATGRPDVKAVQDIIDEIDELCSSPPFIRTGWLLVTLLASGFAFGDRANDLATQVERFLTYVARHPDDKALSPKVLQAIPLAFYVIGDLQRAAQYTERLMTTVLKDKLSNAEAAGLEFNRLSYLLEFEQLRPTRSEARRKRLKAMVEEGLNDPNLKLVPGLASCIEDTQGLFDIVFGETSTEVKRGIAKCNEAAKNAAPDEKDVAEACRDWRLEAGWRRYFDLSDRGIG